MPRLLARIRAPASSPKGIGMIYLDLIDSVSPHWHNQAACNHGLSRDFWPDNHDPDTWYPNTPAGRTGHTGRPAREDATAPAIAICNTCPVKRQCYDAAVANRETSGIWGGVDFERNHVRELEPCGTEAAYFRHVRAKETVCDPCRKAHRAAAKARRAA